VILTYPEVLVVEPVEEKVATGETVLLVAAVVEPLVEHSVLIMAVPGLQTRVAAVVAQQ
jgi:hypothetical protein